MVSGGAAQRSLGFGVTTWTVAPSRTSELVVPPQARICWASEVAWAWVRVMSAATSAAAKLNFCCLMFCWADTAALMADCTSSLSLTSRSWKSCSSMPACTILSLMQLSMASETSFHELVAAATMS